MKRVLMALGVAVSLAGFGAALGGQTITAKEKAKPSMKKQLLFVSPDKADFKEMAPGASRALVWGSDAGGPYGAYTKMNPGFDAGMHTHTHDVWLVVIRGAYIYRDEAGEKRVGPGDFIRVPGGHKHWSGSDPKEGALFYEESTDKFDMIPAK
jgi:mannose-6-phosphate isomerase-like protein (cupin superfamily)